MSFQVKQAKRQRRPLKISLEGLSGSGKTFTALRLAFAMRRAGIGKRIVVADSENESAGLYDGVSIDGEVWQFETCAIPHDKQTPAGYAECYEYLVEQGFDLIIFDSLSHAWHGAMEQVDNYARANKGDKFGGWAKVTPDQRLMLTTLTDPRAHLIATMRVKSEYERIEREGKSAQIKKVGLKTDQRDGAEYEFDCVVRLDSGHEAHVEKVRGCSAMDNKNGERPGPNFWKPLFDWWLSAEAVPAPMSQSERGEMHGRAIDAALTIDALKAVMTAVNEDAKAGRLTTFQIEQLGKRKDIRKAALAQPQPASAKPEGEHRADPTPKAPTPPATNGPTPKPPTTSAPTRPTADPSDGIVKVNGNHIQGILKLAHEVGVSWSEIRDGAEGKGARIADAAALPKMPVDFKINQLSATEGLRLMKALEAEVAKKRERAANRNGKTEEVGAGA